MSGEVHVLPPIAVIYKEEVLESGLLAPAPPVPHAEVDPAQLREVDQVFSDKNQEADRVTGLIGMYTGVMLLHDLAIEAFAPGAGEFEEDELKKKPRLEPKAEK
ncbi:MAG TPA: hypothetical protein VGP68_16510 [Gemmataceae bacterium]|jgi:hypothetical protein|nr:hypothetical protein [Gemmataceae bacterium]